MRISDRCSDVCSSDLFILAALGTELGMLPPEGRDLILAGAIISIFLNPLIFALIVAHPEPAEPEEKAPKAIAAKGHVILIGYGRVGSLIAAELKKRGQSDRKSTRLNSRH